LFEHLPIEMRAMSAISSVLFSCFGVAVGYLYFKYDNLKGDVVDSGLDIGRLDIAIDNIEKMVESQKDDYHEMVEWVRTDNTTNYKRIEDSLKEIRKQLYRGS